MAAMVALGAALEWSIRLARADILFRGDTREGVARAIELEPGNAEYYVRLAELLDGGEREKALERAVALNPRDSGAWIELGLREEISKDFSKAERCLLEAARVDKTYEPRGTLAHYYFRRGEEEKFWHWVREALGTAYGEMAPLFRLCRSVEDDSGVILRRAIPNRPEALRQYLSFLLPGDEWQAAGAVAEKMLERGRPEDAPVLLAYCDRLLEARQGTEATLVWNLMAARKLIGYSALRPQEGAVLSNASFAVAPRSQGFDWRFARTEGISVSREQKRPVLEVTFSGKQPEQCEVLSQYLPLAPARKYRLEFEYETAGIGAGAGLRWQVFDLSNGSRLIGESAALSHEGWTEGKVAFTAPEGLKLGRLTLNYRRVAGTARIVGSVSLRNLALGFDEHAR